MRALALHLLQQLEREEVAGRARRADHEVGELQVAPEILERHGRTVELARELDGAIERAVREHQRADAVRLEMPRDELRHLARADQHRGLVRERLEDLQREVDRDRADGDAPRRDAGLGAHALRDRERLVEDAVEDGAGRARLGGEVVEALQLAEDLRLADHHRVEARRHAEEMADGVAVVMDEEMLREGRRRDAALAREELADRPGYGIVVAPERERFDSIAGRDERRLLHAVDRREPRERRRQRAVLEREPLAQLDRRRVMVQADDPERSAAAHDPKLPP